ncbi:hypothetical protein BDZ45DRAFT_598329, partial [Acephala macrosclerotiorum]
DTFKSKPRSGLARKTSDRDDRALFRHAFNNSKDTFDALGIPFKSTHELSRNTVCKILKEHGKAKRKSRCKLYLKPEHKKKRLI